MFKRTLIAAVAVMLVVGAAAILPSFLRTRGHPSTNACVNNLRQIAGAKEQWALECHKTVADTPSWEDLRPYFGRSPRNELPACPMGGVYTMGKVGDSPRCSIGPPYHTLN
jgi:general secretion pathway protein G